MELCGESMSGIILSSEELFLFFAVRDGWWLCIAVCFPELFQSSVLCLTLRLLPPFLLIICKGSGVTLIRRGSVSNWGHYPVWLLQCLKIYILWPTLWPPVTSRDDICSSFHAFGPSEQLVLQSSSFSGGQEKEVWGDGAAAGCTACTYVLEAHARRLWDLFYLTELSV